MLISINVEPDFKKQFLLRLFSSIMYSVQLSEHFIQLIDNRLLRLERYKALPYKLTTEAKSIQ
ncbi:hypothetical protein [Rheinheimera sp. MMS21-TC3]|uniref:hypothetical protein n=1 Tax=Rheinheimera sp. MMS21-TC3 TaxID=3072790 RepID=UPI0028C41C82|nr:hypothetical protein [Rheinheimera sp. MMS21-TC3]WNO60341.1 hypothetical protein RDV63_05090 [Rheinheimera sp. MMS21-TC3]